VQAIRCCQLGIFVCILEVILRSYYPTHLAYFGIFFRFDSLLYGAFLALILNSWKRTSIPVWAARGFSIVFFLAMAGEIGILFCLRPILGREIRDSPLLLGPGLSLMGVATASLIGLLVLRSNTDWWFARLLRLSTLQFLGTISYTMYIVHIIVALVVMVAFTRLERLLPEGYLFIESLVSALVTIAIARLSWHFLEKPLLRWKDRLFPSVQIEEPTLD
jgi:peptidoglycan/LPS O-acetylase OafA/YrhL